VRQSRGRETATLATTCNEVQRVCNDLDWQISIGRDFEHRVTDTRPTGARLPGPFCLFDARHDFCHDPTCPRTVIRSSAFLVSIRYFGSRTRARCENELAYSRITRFAANPTCAKSSIDGTLKDFMRETEMSRSIGFFSAKFKVLRLACLIKRKCRRRRSWVSINYTNAIYTFYYTNVYLRLLDLLKYERMCRFRNRWSSPGFINNRGANDANVPLHRYYRAILRPPVLPLALYSHCDFARIIADGHRGGEAARCSNRRVGIKVDVSSRWNPSVSELTKSDQSEALSETHSFTTRFNGICIRRSTRYAIRLRESSAWDPTCPRDIHALAR